MPTPYRLLAPAVLPCDPECSVLRDAAVDVDSTGRIGYVGPSADAPESSAPVVACSGILLPGLVNVRVTPRSRYEPSANSHL